jgi:hypothetical protein
MPEEDYITPNVLKWARESARMSEEIAAAKVSHMPSFFYPKYQEIFNLFRTTEEKQRNRLVQLLFLLLEKYSKNKLG